jgi:hypothetical protein
MTACRSEINYQARREAADFVDEAMKAYQSATDQMDQIFDEPPGADKLVAMKSRKPRFEQAAADFKVAKEKFGFASAKFNEALNGGNRGDSVLHHKCERLSIAYKKWSELADVDNQIAEEAINIKDTKLVLNKIKELEAKAEKLSLEVDTEIKNSRIS